MDVDAEIVRREGRSIESIFANEGEAHFRAIEAEAVERATTASRVVIAPGGGWASAGSDRLSRLPDDTFSVWLRIRAESAVDRARRSPVVRPLLSGPDPIATAFALLAAREPFYAPARLHLEVEGAEPLALVETVVSAMRMPPPSR